MNLRGAIVCGAVLSLLGGAAQAVPPADLSAFAYHQQPGRQLPPDARFRDADGGTVRFGALSGGMPVILALGYFHCPNLCGVVRDDMIHALASSTLRAGRDYSLVVLSIDPAETVHDAAAAEAQDAAAYGHQDAARAWHYLTGPAASIRAVADAVGFRDRLDEQTKQFVHPAGLVFLTRSGVVSSYLLGVGYTQTDLQEAVARARLSRIARAGLPVLLICFHFNAATGRYTLAIMKVLRLAGVLTVMTIAGLLFLLFRRERHGV